MEINFLELLKFIQENENNKIFDNFLEQVSNLNENPDVEIEIRIPTELIDKYLESKL